MTTQLDLAPATRRMADLVNAVPEDALGHPTPCADYTVGDLLDHIGGAALAFTAAAAKKQLEAGPSGDASRLGSDWRARISRDVLALADAWRDPETWTGTTAAGGVDLPGEIAGRVALDEMVIHGWDLARATGQRSAYDGPELASVYETVANFRASGVEGLFGPEVRVADDAPLLDRIVGLAGRDPGWTSPEKEARR
jgi:uncharacterized protein (TIGR03086 family)